MNRREVLQSLLYGVTGAGIVAAGGVEARAATPRGASVNRPRHGPFVEIPDGARLYYREWGKGRPVLFLHSWAVNADLWQYQMIHLADRGVRCIAYDLRGHGRSSDPGRGYDYDTLGDDLGAVLEHTGAVGAILVGHSMGCGVITRYLTRHGAGRVARVVFVSPTLPFLLKTADNPQGIDPAALDRLRGLWSRDFPSWLADNARPFFAAETSGPSFLVSTYRRSSSTATRTSPRPSTSPRERWCS